MESETFAMILRMNRIFILGGKMGRYDKNIKEEKMPRVKLWGSVSILGIQQIDWCGWNSGHKEQSFGDKAGE